MKKKVIRFKPSRARAKGKNLKRGRVKPGIVEIGPGDYYFLGEVNK